MTPHSTTGVSPAELLLGRRIRSHLDQLQPNLTNRVSTRQQAQKKNHDSHAKFRSLQVGDSVFVTNFNNGPKWLSGTIHDVRGPVSFTVSLTDSRLVRKHIDQIRFRTVTVELNDNKNDDVDFLVLPSSTSTWTTSIDRTPSSVTASPAVCRSNRICHPPDRYTPDDAN
ncbi:uncharacterized protein [Dysidea avara]|uniref:uncharacterized protein n=1 Tax=Dysidea avara TaxID=196820 RepID=UPI003323A96F